MLVVTFFQNIILEFSSFLCADCIQKILAFFCFNIFLLTSNSKKQKNTGRQRARSHLVQIQALNRTKLLKSSWKQQIPYRPRYNADYFIVHWHGSTVVVKLATCFPKNPPPPLTPHRPKGPHQTLPGYPRRPSVEKL